MAKQIAYPADTVDSNGKVWDTVGENIRNGGKNTEALLKAIYGEDAEIKRIDVDVTPTAIKSSSSDFLVGGISLWHKQKNIIGFLIGNSSITSGSINATVSNLIIAGQNLIGLKLKENPSDNITYSLSLLMVLK